MAKVSDNLLRFIESEAFTAQREQLGITNDDLIALMNNICGNPKVGDVVKGAGGFRKIRFRSARMREG